MIEFDTRIERYGEMGEKTGWTHILIPARMADSLLPGRKTSFRVKGRLDNVSVSGMALIPVGGGDFILPLRAELRRALKKEAGQDVNVVLEFDPEEPELNPDFALCLEDAPAALAHFQTLTPGHQRYFSKWISEAKTLSTREKRILEALRALEKKWGFPEMLRARKEFKD